MLQCHEMIIKDYCTGARHGPWGQNLSKRWKGRVDVWCFHERNTIQYRTAKNPTYRGNWGRNEKRQAEVARYVEKEMPIV